MSPASRRGEGRVCACACVGIYFSAQNQGRVFHSHPRCDHLLQVVQASREDLSINFKFITLLAKKHPPGVPFSPWQSSPFLDSAPSSSEKMAEAATAATTATATAETSAATGVVSKQLLGKYGFHLLKLRYVILPAILNWLFRP